MRTPVLESPVEFIKGVGPFRAKLFNDELNIIKVEDLLFDFPYRYADRPDLQKIEDIKEDGQTIQIKGYIKDIKSSGQHGRQRLEAWLEDDTGRVKLVWFRGAKWIMKNIQKGREYIINGKANYFKSRISIPHPEMEYAETASAQQISLLAPFYHSTERMTSSGLDSKARRKIIKHALDKITVYEIPEILPLEIVRKMHFCSRYDAINWIHLPQNERQKQQAIDRLKFEELFFVQYKLLFNKFSHDKKIKGHIFDKVGEYLNRFYSEKIPFELTGAQKRVIREIRRDMGSGVQMNRLLQGDVGSGKTIVALMTSLIALDNGFQTCMMAPTEILAQQHFRSLSKMLSGLDVEVELLTGNVKGKKRTKILQRLLDGEIHILVGTHAVIEDPVIFQNLGLSIIDEQHRFGVEQRSKLWRKGKDLPPHILVMTATPIPRTLAMTAYGDLEVSRIDELPPGRKAIKTVHIFDHKRPQMIEFLRKEIHNGRQVYIVYPLIDESEKLDLENLSAGYEQLLIDYPRPKYQICIVHGKQKSRDKDVEMQRFAEGRAQIMVATTVIEVGVDVPNASIMVIENAERFGLSQLHQLRGRVGRGADQSYCILKSSYKLSEEAKKRLSTMVTTNDGFKIAEVDLEIRGPGDVLGTRQSGIEEFRLASYTEDRFVMESARILAWEIINDDPALLKQEHFAFKKYLQKSGKNWVFLSKVG
jgi:ATP-dependent DNA helicase RecG